jgi:hypothetical protein
VEAWVERGKARLSGGEVEKKEKRGKRKTDSRWQAFVFLLENCFANVSKT